MEYSVLASVYRGLVDILKESGWSPEALSDEIGSDIQCLDIPQKALAIEQVTKLWELGFKQHGAAVGIRAAQRLKLVDLQDFGVFLGASQNITDWMEQVDHYSTLFSNVGTFNSRLCEAGLAITIHYNVAVPLLHERLEFIALMHPIWVSQYLSSPLKLAQVELTRPTPEDSSEWDKAFGVTVKWGAPATKYVVSYREAGRLILTRNEQMRRGFESLLDSRLKQKNAASPLDSVRNEISTQLGGGAPNLDSVAAALNLSTRSLQRRLQQANTSFSVLLGSVRALLAKQYLDLDMPVNEVAFRLGYTETSNFNRAFLGWEGVAPSDYKNER
jgi:AraC-like DNA-binding protein